MLLLYSSSGAYEIANAEGVQPGTKIVLHLRPDCREFSDDNTVNGKITSRSSLPTFTIKY